MVFEIELVYLIAMLATFICLLVFAKTSSGVALMCSSIVGAVLGAIFSGTEFNLRHFIEGGSGYFDTILTIIGAMIFIQGLRKSGAMEYISAGLVKVFRKAPTVLIISFMVILMLPGMLTGSSLSAVISVGALVTPIMLGMGIPRGKVGAIIAFGAILGMIAPPINVPVLAICDVVDIPYDGFTEPLLFLTFPIAIFAALFLSRDFHKQESKKAFKENHNLIEELIVLGVLVLAVVAIFLMGIITKEAYYIPLAILNVALLIGDAVVIFVGRPYKKELDLEEMKENTNFEVLKELNVSCLVPVFVLIVLFILQQVLPYSFGMMPSFIIFTLAYLPAIFTGRKSNPIICFKEGVKDSFGAMALLIGVGMFVQIMTLIGVRGWFVINAISLPNIGKYIGMAISLPIFGGISSFGSSSILGGPFVMALLGTNSIFVASALSLLAAVGEFFPPTAISATFAGRQVGINKWQHVTKHAIIPIAVTLVYAMLFIILVAA